MATKADRKDPNVVVTDCPRQRIELMAETLNEGFAAIGYFDETGELLKFACAPIGEGFLLSVERDGKRYTRTSRGERVAPDFLASVFVELSKMHKAEALSGDALHASLQRMVEDIAGGKTRSIALDAAACVAKIEDGSLVLEATATDGLRFGFRTERPISVDTLMSLLAQANEFILLRTSKSLDEIAETMAGRGAKFMRHERGGKVRLYGGPPPQQ